MRSKEQVRKAMREAEKRRRRRPLLQALPAVKPPTAYGDSAVNALLRQGTAVVRTVEVDDGDSQKQ